MTRTTRKRKTNIHRNRKIGPKKTSGEIKKTEVKHGIKRKVERVRTEKGVEEGVETKKRGERGMHSSHTHTHTLCLIVNYDYQSPLFI